MLFGLRNHLPKGRLPSEPVVEVVDSICELSALDIPSRDCDFLGKVSHKREVDLAGDSGTELSPLADVAPVFASKSCTS